MLKATQTDYSFDCLSEGLSLGSYGADGDLATLWSEDEDDNDEEDLTAQLIAAMRNKGTSQSRNPSPTKRGLKEKTKELVAASATRRKGLFTGSKYDSSSSE